MFQVDLGWVTAASLLWVRLGVLLGLSPIATTVRGPVVVWVLLSLALAGVLAAALGLRAPVPSNLGGYVFAVLGEATLGALMGFSLHAAFAALSMAGRLLDLQMGFSMAVVLDPVTRANAPIMGVMLSLVGMAVFFAVDGHHALLRGFVYAAKAVPPGGVWALPDARLLLRPISAMFSGAVVIAAPVMFLLLLIEVVLAVVSRVLPQMNVMFVGMPVKAMVGMAVLAIAAPGLLPPIQRVFGAVFGFWTEVMP